MPEVTSISSRKSDHIRTNLEENVQSGLTTGLENYRFVHRALPEINLEDIDLSISVFGKSLAAPLLISSMTGGTEEAAKINRTLAEAAQATGIAMGLGSQRAAIEQPELIETFQVRSVAPDILLFANLGAIQLNYGYGIEQCQRAVDMIEADALILHLNSMQEALQPEGETNFAGLLKKIEGVCRSLKVPVIAKEVGWGFSVEDIRLLANAGISAIDVAGAGGTSWSQVEMHRAKNERQARLAATFVDWGIPTSEAILNVRQTAPELPVIASGGIRSGMDIAKCLALGACIGGMANPYLKAAVESLDATVSLINDLKREIRICMFGCGASNIPALKDSKLVKIREK
jgi:isopentenyl-diphosphate delta-isomerase